jgi:hypothetical protein
VTTIECQHAEIDYHVAVDLTYTSDVLNSSVREQKKKKYKAFPSHASARESTKRSSVSLLHFLEGVF